MRYIIIALLACSCTRNHLGEQKYEGGVVFEKQFAPEINASGSGIGMSSEGSTVITHTSIHEAAKYILFFKCDHGVMFQVEDKQLWTDLTKGDTVQIVYHDILDEDNRLVDYKFITAHKP